MELEILAARWLKRLSCHSRCSRRPSRDGQLSVRSADENEQNPNPPHVEPRHVLDCSVIQVPRWRRRMANGQQRKKPSWQNTPSGPPLFWALSLLPTAMRLSTKSTQPCSRDKMKSLKPINSICRSPSQSPDRATELIKAGSRRTSAQRGFTKVDGETIGPWVAGEV